MADLADLIGNTYGPFPIPVTGDLVAAFAAATGDDPNRWSSIAPAMLANVALFAAAPAFLRDDAVVPFTRSLIHSDQSFVWLRPLEVGETLEVAGTVEAARARGPLNLVTFSLIARSDRGPWLTGSSVFLMSEEAATAAEDAGEPDAEDRPPFDPAGDRLELPVAGDPIVELRCGASRSDLMRYAVASEDWNPIHFDHDAARAAGLAGVIVHGLLMASWIGRLASRYGTMDAMRLRFRNPLRPAVPAVVTGLAASVVGNTAELNLVLSAEGRRLVTSVVSVTA